jgi:hypothetical protein
LLLLREREDDLRGRERRLIYLKIINVLPILSSTISLPPRWPTVLYPWLLQEEEGGMVHEEPGVKV